MGCIQVKEDKQVILTSSKRKTLFLYKQDSLEKEMNILQGSLRNQDDLKKWQITVEARELHGLRDRSGSRGRNADRNPEKKDRHRDLFSIFGDEGMSLEVDNVISDDNTKKSSFKLERSAGSSRSLPLIPPGEPLIVSFPEDQTFHSIGVVYGAHSRIGMRPSNEDRHVTVCSEIGNESIGYFGLYDGHSGSEVSEYLSKHFHKVLFENISKDREFEKCIIDTCSSVDNMVYDEGIQSGSTAICMCIRGSRIAFASVGDSQIVLCQNGIARVMCDVHTPDLPSEQSRILKANGKVIDGRIFGVLSVSRAFGDNDLKTSKGEFKEKYNGDIVSSEPDIVIHDMEKGDEFAVLGCDGLFDVMTPQNVVNFVRSRLYTTGDTQQVCQDLISHALRLGSTDNVSVIIVCLNQNTNNSLTSELPINVVTECSSNK